MLIILQLVVHVEGNQMLWRGPLILITCAKRLKKISKNFNRPIAPGDMDNSDEQLARVLDQYDEDLKVTFILENQK